MLTSDVATPWPIYLAKALICHQAHPTSARSPYTHTGGIGLLTFQHDSNNSNRHANDGSNDADAANDSDDGDKGKYDSLGYLDYYNYRNPAYSCSRRYVHIDQESPVLAKPRFSTFSSWITPPGQTWSFLAGQDWYLGTIYRT